MRSQRVTVDGKFFALAGARFRFRGVTYGTFAPRGDGARFPELDQVERDFTSMQRCGFTVVRTYTTPPDDIVRMAAGCDQRLLVGAFYPDWRYLVGSSRRQSHQVLRGAVDEVRRVARRFAGDERVLALSLGNEIPADVLRWFGKEHIARALRELIGVVREEDPDQLVTYANYPTTEYLPLEDLDFVTFNVFLERPQDFRRYLTRLHHLAGDRPLVMGEVGLNSGSTAHGEQHQAKSLDWMLETAVERGVAGTSVFSWTDEWWVGDAAVEGWHFGLTRADRSPKPALAVAERWNHRDVRDLDLQWPSMSVVVCAYNAGSTLDECLRHTCALDYPRLEIIVVDDGSTDDTAEIARQHPRVRLVSVPHAGLSVARNCGFSEATGDVVAYLDSDAYPSPEWPWYLAIGFDASTVAGAGGPNVPPRDDPAGAQRVAHAPGGPVHVLVSDDRAEHVPGCNMAFWKGVLTEVGGFDPIYTSAGDDVDLCWKVLDRDWEIGFHPAALVWHHRRAGLRPYLRQQRGYGRSEALVEARHPNRFNPIGAARWRGRIYNSFAPRLVRQRVYHGVYGSAAYQSVYHAGGHLLDVAHQAGVPLLVLLAMLAAPLAVVDRSLGYLAVAAVVALVALFTTDAVRASPPRRLAEPRWRFRLGVAAMHLCQPIVRFWGRSRSRAAARRDAPRALDLPGPVEKLPRGVLLFPATMARAEFAWTALGHVHHAGFRVAQPTGWENHDARIVGSFTIAGDLVTTAYPEGCIQLKVRPRVRWYSTLLLTTVAAALWLLGTPLLPLLALLAVDIGRGLWAVGPKVRRLLLHQPAQPPPARPRSEHEPEFADQQEPAWSP